MYVRTYVCMYVRMYSTVNLWCLFIRTLPLALFSSSSSPQFLLHTGDSFVVPLKGHRPAPDLTCEECDVSVCVHVCVCACACVWYIHTCVCLWAYVCACISTYARTYIRTYSVCMCLCKLCGLYCTHFRHTYTYLQIRTYVHTDMYRVLQNGCRECHSTYVWLPFDLTLGYSLYCVKTAIVGSELNCESNDVHGNHFAKPCLVVSLLFS